MSTATATDDSHEVITIALGIELCVEKSAYLEHEDHINKLVRRCKLAVLGRDKARARIKECIDLLARLDEKRGGNEDGLVMLSYGMGWTSNFTSHTTDDYRRALTALADALEEAECQADLPLAVLAEVQP